MDIIDRIKEWWDEQCWLHRWETGRRGSYKTRVCSKCGEPQIKVRGRWRWDENRYK